MNGPSACHLDTRLVRDPGRVEDDHLVSWVQNRLHCVVDGILGTTGNQHLLGDAEKPVFPVDLLRDGVQQLRDPVARSVMGLTGFERLHAGILNVLGGVKIGFPD
ncbi:MAG: hypothetical protein A4E36_01640 [Methanoregulaceae archaeon PtaB.Bin009]|nr:MAG: hypothetical protein A4E36_01640 [Methanoregulaceae archaeon PtaB.Bin009]